VRNAGESWAAHGPDVRDGERPLRRSLFFVPGGEPRKLERSRSAGADTLLLDLEDSVAPPEKERARALVASFLQAGDFGGAEPAVRVNPPGTPWFDEDLHAAIAAGARALMLPKAQRADELAEVARRIAALEQRAGVEQPVRVIALVETAAGIANAATLPGATPRIDALCFGHADFSRDMGLVAPDPAQGVLLHARCALAIAARAGMVAPVDTVYLDVRDEAGFRRDAELGLSLGFEGKLCIHPSQVGIANAVYTPTPAQIAYARRVLAAAEQAQAEGRGVFVVDGKMVDAPLIAAQVRVLERGRRAGMDGSAEESHDD
jgi:citrate lyase subunit beta/citryl-CoA lyase